MKKTVLYTCITHHRDPIPPLAYPNPDLDMVLFVDQAELASLLELAESPDIGHWQVRPLLWQHESDPVRTARWHKHNPMECFPDREYSIWTDASCWPATDISWFADWFLKEADIASFIHPWRTSIAEEAEEVIRLRLDDEGMIRAQLARYREAGFTRADDRTLFETTVLVRRHSPRLADLSELWWGEIDEGSRRDQLSFTYCLWKLEMPCAQLLPGHAQHPKDPIMKRGNPYFHFRCHAAKRPIVAL